MDKKYFSKGKVLVGAIATILVLISIYGLILVGFANIYLFIPFIVIMLFGVLIFVYFFIVLFPKTPMIEFKDNELACKTIFGMKIIKYSDITKVLKKYPKDDESKPIGMIKVKMKSQLISYKIQTQFITGDIDDLYNDLLEIANSSYTEEEIEVKEKQEKSKKSTKKIISVTLSSLTLVALLIFVLLSSTSFNRTLKRMDNLESVTITIDNAQVLINGDKIIYLFDGEHPIYCSVNSFGKMYCSVNAPFSYTVELVDYGAFNGDYIDLGFEYFTDIKDMDCHRNDDTYHCTRVADGKRVTLTVDDGYITSIQTPIVSPYFVPTIVTIEFSKFNETEFDFPVEYTPIG